MQRSTALEARDGMARGEFSAIELCEAYLMRIAEREPEIGAFAFLDEAQVRAAAKAADDYRGTGRSLGALHGLPIGIKDIIDTAAMPTENGTVIDAGRRPRKDAEVVSAASTGRGDHHGQDRHDGACLLRTGQNPKPASTRRTRRAARRRARQRQWRRGSCRWQSARQTFGSVIRPASFCGVVGFKPSFGLISRAGVLPLAAPLDTVGVFARTVADAALLADALAGHDPADPDTRLTPPPRMLDVTLTEPPVTPDLAFVKTPMWDEAEPATHEGFAELAEALGKHCTEVALPDVFQEWAGAQRTLMRAGMARNLEPYYRKGKDRLSPVLRGLLEEGKQIAARGLSRCARLARQH